MHYCYSRTIFLPNCKQLNGSMCSVLLGVVLHSVLSLAPFDNIISFEKVSSPSLAPFDNIISFEKVSSPLQLYPNCQHQKSNLMIMSKESRY